MPLSLWISTIISFVPLQCTGFFTLATRVRRTIHCSGTNYMSYRLSVINRWRVSNYKVFTIYLTVYILQFNISSNVSYIEIWFMKLYENTTNSMRNNPEYYEKWLSVILFLIHHLSDNKRIIPKVWEYEKWIWWISFSSNLFVSWICKIMIC